MGEQVWIQVVFWILAVMSIVTALGVILLRNPLHGAISLVGCFIFMAALFVLLKAHLLAAIQVLVYAGAIMVLFIFVIMLFDLRKQDLGPFKFTATKIVGGMGAAYVLYTLLEAVRSAAVTAKVPILAAKIKSGFGGIESVGKQIFTTYLLPFEITSILLLAAIVGAVVIAKRRR